MIVVPTGSVPDARAAGLAADDVSVGEEPTGIIGTVADVQAPRPSTSAAMKDAAVRPAI
jgi:hypothetical protein